MGDSYPLLPTFASSASTGDRGAKVVPWQCNFLALSPWGQCEAERTEDFLSYSKQQYWSAARGPPVALQFPSADTRETAGSKSGASSSDRGGSACHPRRRSSELDRTTARSGPGAASGARGDTSTIRSRTREPCLGRWDWSFPCYPTQPESG